MKLGEAPDEALADLVAGLNAAAGSKVWDYVRTPAALHDAAITDVITNAIIFKPAVVKPTGEAKTIIDETVWDIAREPIAQTFKYGKSFVTVVANHFKSKSGTDPTPQTGQDAFNDERVEQAQSLLTFANTLSEGQKNAVYLVGDFNAYAKEDPIKVFADAGWSDVLFTKARGQYTYTFDGELGSLDHVIASPAANDQGHERGCLGDQLARVGRTRVLRHRRRGGHAVPVERPRPDRRGRRVGGSSGHRRHRPRDRERLPRPHRAGGARRAASPRSRPR